MDGPTDSHWELGEADLYEGVLPRAPLQVLLIGALALVMCIAAGAALVARFAPPPPTPTPPAAALIGVASATPSPQVAPPPTNTRIVVVPTLAYTTVTPQPPTPTITPTVGPCFQVAAPNDTVYGLASRCGHRDMAIVDQILRLNNMNSATELQIGQRLEIPWPTVPGEVAAAVAGEPTLDLGVDSGLGAEPTLPPSLRWYTIRAGETALSIVLDLGITMRILRDLNPEVRFDGCDFGQVGGGPACSVMVFEGQRMRVPAPTPTPTLPPTLTGSETPTFTPTPTFNAPFSVSPSDNMLFESFEFPTLRWVSSGTLRQNETYLLTVEDRTAGITYYVTTRDLSFQIPPDWQPRDGVRHVFSWMVAVAILQDGTTNAIPTDYRTETRTFTWQSR